MIGSSPNDPGKSLADVREIKALKSYNLAISAIDSLFETAVAGHEGAIETLERIASDLSTRAYSEPSQISASATVVPASKLKSEFGEI